MHRTALFVALTLTATVGAADVKVGDHVENLTFKDIRYLSRSLDDFGKRNAFVLVFTNTTCPLVQRYLPILKQIDAQVDHLVEKSVAFADESPEPLPKDLYVFDYTTEVPNIDRSLPGDHTGLADVEGGR